MIYEEDKMNSNDFDEIVKQRCKKIVNVLVEKAKEYASDKDRLHNFNKAAILSGQTREKALWGFALKHYVSFMDMLDKLEEKGEVPSEYMVNEKIGDLINYLILCEASLKHRIYNNKEE